MPKFGSGDVGDGPIGHAVFSPFGDVVALDRAGSGRGIRLAGRWDRGQADQVLAVTVDQRRHRIALDHIDPAANQWEVVLGEIDDTWRFWNAPVEPRLDRMPVRGGDIGR